MYAVYKSSDKHKGVYACVCFHLLYFFYTVYWPINYVNSHLLFILLLSSQHKLKNFNAALKLYIQNSKSFNHLWYIYLVLDLLVCE